MDRSFRDRLKTIRKELNKTQVEVAKLLGVTPGYIAKLEQGLYVPSDQLILSICRVFHVLPGWLRTGVGEKYDQIDRTFYPLIGTICGVINAQSGPLDRFTYALLAGLDLDDFENEGKRIRNFSTIDADRIVRALVEILKEGDKSKIDVVRTLLFSLVPQKTCDPEAEKDLYRREAISVIKYAKRIESTGNLLEAIKTYRGAWWIRADGRHEDIYQLVKNEYEQFIRRNAAYNEAFETIIATVAVKPGIKESTIERRITSISGEAKHLLIWAAKDLGYIERGHEDTRLSGYRLYPVDDSVSSSKPNCTEEKKL